MVRNRHSFSRWFLLILILLTDIAVALTPDGLALLEFKSSLTKLSPLLNNWKASDTSPCSWDGIECTASGYVQNITLSSQVPMLEGNISSSLGRLQFLERLMLHDNLLVGTIPPQLGSLQRLLTLSLYNNNLSGEIPPQLGRCTSLEELWLDGNLMISGAIPESLGNLENLSSLFLGVNFPLGVVLNARQSFNFGNLSGSIPLTIYKNLNLKSFDVSQSHLSGDITMGMTL